MDEEERTLHLLLGCKACQWRSIWRDEPHAFCSECGTSIRKDHPTYPDTGCSCEARIVEL